MSRAAALKLLPVAFAIVLALAFALGMLPAIARVPRSAAAIARANVRLRRRVELKGGLRQVPVFALGSPEGLADVDPAPDGVGVFNCPEDRLVPVHAHRPFFVIPDRDDFEGARLRQISKEFRAQERERERETPTVAAVRNRTSCDQRFPD